MRGHNVNIYFSEEIYNKIKPLIQQRKVSEFVNQAVEKELVKEQQKVWFNFPQLFLRLHPPQ